MHWTSEIEMKGQTVYVLHDHEKTLLTLEFHRSTSWVRVRSGKEERVLLIQLQGLLRKKAMLKNEYGVAIGELRHDKGEHFIELNNKKYHYQLTMEANPEIRITRNRGKVLLTVCSLALDPIYFSKKKKLPAKLEAGMLLSLCWYLSKTIKTKEVTETAL